jgi:hypothetical protein
MADDVYLDGDPETESTRRHMERVLKGDGPRRWPWLLGMLAGGTAIAFWRRRRARRAEDAATRPAGREPTR